MSTRTRQLGYFWMLAGILAWPMAVSAQVPVDESGKPVGEYQPAPATGSEELPVLSTTELEELIGPIALYPDDLLAIILPASTYPLQIVQAARFLEDLEKDSSLKPDEDWDDSVVALTNYPEIVEMMSEDLDWTWKLGEAVVAQQTDVITAIESFRDRAYAAGNLKSDDFQTVTEEDGTIQITPVQEDVIYVPYYEPERVVVYQPRPVYYYYPRPYPLYYYPYPLGYSFAHDYFWGVTTAFRIGWYTNHLHVWHHSYHGHPYYGRHYYRDWWYRRPDIHIYNNYYVRNRHNVHYDRYRRGDYWQPNTRRTVRSSDQRITRTRYYPNPNSTANSQRSRTVTPTARNTSRSRTTSRDESALRGPTRDRAVEERREVTFRERMGTATTNRSRQQRQPSRPSVEDRRRETSTVRERSTNRPTLARSSGTSRPSVARRSEPTRSFVRPSRPTQSSSRSSRSRQSVSRPTQSRQSVSRPSQSRQSSPSRSRSSSSSSSRSKSSKSNSGGNKVANNSRSRSSDSRRSARRR